MRSVPIPLCSLDFHFLIQEGCIWFRGPDFVTSGTQGTQVVSMASFFPSKLGGDFVESANALLKIPVWVQSYTHGFQTACLCAVHKPVLLDPKGIRPGFTCYGAPSYG